MPGTNWETLLGKYICHIICLTNVSVFYIVLPVSANGERVFHHKRQTEKECFQEANFVSAIKVNVSRYGRQENIWANIENYEYFRDNVSYVWPRL
jgi:hypothetical protein